MVVEKGCSINNETPKDRIASCWAYTISHNDPQYQLPWQIKTEMQVHPAKAPIVANWGQAGPRPIQSLTAHLNELEKAFVHHDYNECHIITRRVTAGYRGRTDGTVLECLFQLRCHNQSFSRLKVCSEPSTIFCANRISAQKSVKLIKQLFNQ